MGVATWIETDPPGEPLDPCPRTDGKDFRRFLASDAFATLAGWWGVDVEPLRSVHAAVDIAAVRAEWGDAEVEAVLAQSDRAWRSPATFASCLGGQAERLGRLDGRVRDDQYALADPQGVHREYVQCGLFLADVLSCREAFLRAKARGARRARLAAG